MRITVRVKPRASRDEVVPESESLLIVRTTAAPADGKANEAVRRLVAEHYGLAPSRVTLFRGATSREKVFDIVF